MSRKRKRWTYTAGRRPHSVTVAKLNCRAGCREWVSIQIENFLPIETVSFNLLKNHPWCNRHVIGWLPLQRGSNPLSTAGIDVRIMCAVFTESVNESRVLCRVPDEPQCGCISQRHVDHGFNVAAFIAVGDGVHIKFNRTF